MSVRFLVSLTLFYQFDYKIFTNFVSKNTSLIDLISQIMLTDKTDIFTDFSKLNRQNRQISAQKILGRQNRHLVIFDRNSADLADK